MRKIRFILKETIQFFALFIFFFVWCRYFSRNFGLSVTLSIIFSILALGFLFLFNKKRKQRSALKQNEKIEAENIYFSLATEKDPMRFFFKLAQKKHKFVTYHKSYLVIDYPLEKVKTILYFDANYDGLGVSKLVEIYKKVKKEKATKIVVCCREITDKNLFLFLSSFTEKIVVLNQYQTYEKLYKAYSFFPEVTICQKPQQKPVFKDFIAYSFNKKRTKGYLFSAFILFLSSLFVSQTFYYCLMSSILLLLALISEFNPYFNLKKEEVI